MYKKSSKVNRKHGTSGGQVFCALFSCAQCTVSCKRVSERVERTQVKHIHSHTETHNTRSDPRGVHRTFCARRTMCERWKGKRRIKYLCLHRPYSGCVACTNIANSQGKCIRKKRCAWGRQEMTWQLVKGPLYPSTRIQLVNLYPHIHSYIHIYVCVHIYIYIWMCLLPFLFVIITIACTVFTVNPLFHHLCFRATVHPNISLCLSSGVTIVSWIHSEALCKLRVKKNNINKQFACHRRQPLIM